MRAMPNVASSVCAGVTMLVRGTYANDEDVSLTRAIFEPIGLVEEGTDAMLNIVSGFGSTPAYVSMIMTRKVGINLGSLGGGGHHMPEIKISV